METVTAAAEHCASFLLYLDDIQAHVNDMLSTGAVVSGSRVALQSITEVTTVQIMVPQVIMASPGEKGWKMRRRQTSTKTMLCENDQFAHQKTLTLTSFVCIYYCSSKKRQTAPLPLLLSWTTDLIQCSVGLKLKL